VGILFLSALSHFQAYGSKEEDIEKYMRNGILSWGKPVELTLESGGLLVNQVRQTTSTFGNAALGCLIAAVWNAFIQNSCLSLLCFHFLPQPIT